MPHGPHRPHGLGHPHHEAGDANAHGHAHGERDWATFGAQLELEGEVTMPLLGEAFDAISRATGSVEGIRRVLDLGSGPGVASVALAQRFPRATVTAVDASESLLDLASVRAALFDVGERVDTRAADFEESLGSVAADGTVDVVWASMVLHHVVKLPRMLADVHRLLRPGGLIAVVELRHLHGTLPIGFDVGQAGFVERLGAAVRVSLEEHLPPGALSLDWCALLTDAGFDLIDHDELAMKLPGPLDDAPRQLVLRELQGSAHRVTEHLDDADLEVLAALVDATDPRCILHRDDLSLAISRRFILARRH